MMTTLAMRLKKRMDYLGLTQDELAESANISQGAIHKILSGKTKETRKIFSLATALRCDANWLAKGEGNDPEEIPIETTLPAPTADAAIEIPSDEDYAFVPLYDVRASAGNGHPVEHELIKGTLAFQREWLRSKGLAVKNLSVIYAMGKSMEPRINDGDVLLIDASQRNIKDGKVYAIRWHGELRIKRLVRDYDGSVRIISDNKSPDYPEQHVPADALGQLEIIGRVVWMGGDL